MRRNSTKETYHEKKSRKDRGGMLSHCGCYAACGLRGKHRHSRAEPTNAVGANGSIGAVRYNYAKHKQHEKYGKHTKLTKTAGAKLVGD